MYEYPKQKWRVTEDQDQIDREKRQRIIILGAGPTGLGAAYRLYERGILRTNTQVIILEMQQKPGGLAGSHRDDAGFVWDNGGHVIFSHYEYFTQLLDHAVSKWNHHKRAAFAFMKGSSGNRSFIPYPVQQNVYSFDKQDSKLVIEDLEKLIWKRKKNPAKKPLANFDEWLVNNFGEVLSDIFMRKYNKKIWTLDPKQMNAVWVSERVAVPDLKMMKKERLSGKDSKWGPNYLFRFPRYNGTGGIWQAVADLLPRSWFHYGHKVDAVSIAQKKLHVQVNQEKFYTLEYDILISTAPLDVFVQMDNNEAFFQKRQFVSKLVFTVTHIVGIGLKGQPPKFLSDKSWIYFPDSDAPFYRATVFSKYSKDHTMHPESQWSLMCECAQPKTNINETFWSQYSIVEQTIIALVEYGYITRNQVLSKFYHRLDHGYPVPSILRESVLSVIQPWLESNKVFSRGRFGGWRYEVGNQDHSLMQGVEIADFILKGIPEETYSNANLVNSMKASNRSLGIPVVSELVPDYELVISHYNENLTWISEHAGLCHIYHKGKSVIPDFEFRKWEILPNIGRESHTYLYHIITNYNRLANVTIFLQGGANHHRGYTYMDLGRYYNESIIKGFSAKHCSRSKYWGKVFPRNKLTLGEFWKEAFGSDHPDTYFMCLKGSFAVTREVIQRKHISYYKKLIKYLENSSNPLDGHYFERFWKEGVFSIF